MRKFFYAICSIGLLFIDQTFATEQQADPYVVLFVLDGVGRDVLYQAMQAGQLPTLQQLFGEQGTRFTDATTNFPSATSPNYPAMIAGLYPGHLGAPYLAWLDRERQKRRSFLDLRGRRQLRLSVQNWYANEHSPDPRAVPRTLFDLLAPRCTAAIYVPYVAGATTHAPRSPFGAAWDIFVRGRPEALNADAMRMLQRRFTAPHARVPHFSMVGLFATDIIAHHEGTHHPRVIDALRTFDRQLADFLRVLDTRGLRDRTYLAITSDHGMHDIRGIIHLPEALAALGLRVTTNSPTAHEHVYVAARGIASATLTVRAPDQPWRVPIDDTLLTRYPVRHGTVNILQWLRAHPQIDTVLVRRAGSGSAEQVTMLYRRETAAQLRSVAVGSQRRYSYQPLQGDPLQLRRSHSTRALANGQLATAADWNRRLAATPWPAGVPQLAQIFDDGRAGDIIVIATPERGFFHDKAATHGSYAASDMRVPLLFHGPGIPQATRTTAQIVDLAPTIAAWFGKQFPVQIDGDNLFK